MTSSKNLKLSNKAKNWYRYYFWCGDYENRGPENVQQRDGPFSRVWWWRHRKFSNFQIRLKIFLNFPKTGINAEQNELSSRFWSHCDVCFTRFPTIYYLYMFVPFSKISKFGSRNRCHRLDTWPALNKNISRKYSQINFRKSHQRPVEKNHYWGSTNSIFNSIFSLKKL